MQKIIRITGALLILFALGQVAPVTNHALVAASGGPLVEPAVLRALETESETPLRLIVKLRPADARIAAPATSQTAQPLARAALLALLQHDFAAALQPLTPLLEEGQRRGEIETRRDLWIIRALMLTGTPAFVHRLIASPAVAEVRLDRYTQYLDPAETIVPQSTTGTGPTWGLTQIRAPEVWATLGISGTGAVVAIMDTGVDLLHPALNANYRGKLGQGLYDHSIAWFDAVNGGLYPYDDHGHGTHVAGIAVGTGNIGVAPGAKWIAVKVLSGEGYGYDSWIHAGFQWLLAPGGDPGLAPDVVNNS